MLLRRLKRRLARVHLRKSNGQISAIKLPELTPVELTDIQRHFPLPKFFIFGHGRSGTTLLARLIRLHPEVHCNWQAHFFTKKHPLAGVLSTTELGEWLERRSNRWAFEQDLATPIIRVVCDYIMEREANRLGKRIVGDKSPDSSPDVAVPILKCVYPEARLIHIIRDGRDAVLSRRFQLFIDAPGVLDPADLEIRDLLRRNRDRFGRGKQSIFTSSWLEKSAMNWAHNVHNTDASAHELFGERYFYLRFEDLISDPVVWMEQVWSFLEASPATEEVKVEIHEEMKRNPAVEWQESKALEFVRHLRRGEPGAWRDMFTVEDEHLFEHYAGEELTAWGYEVRDG